MGDVSLRMKVNGQNRIEYTTCQVKSFTLYMVDTSQITQGRWEIDASLFLLGKKEASEQTEKIFLPASHAESERHRNKIKGLFFLQQPNWKKIKDEVMLQKRQEERVKKR